MAVVGAKPEVDPRIETPGCAGVPMIQKEPPMRVLLAIDGSPSSDAARDLLTSLDWPEGSSVRVVGVVEVTSPGLIGYAPYVVPYVDVRALERSLKATLAEMADSLQVAGLQADHALLRGRPGSRIVEAAAEYGAELIVLGSRGMGRIESMLLGSVSAEVVDHAPCPVLVARSDTVGRMLLATDGSVTAGVALEHVASTGYLARVPIDVIAVAQTTATAMPVTEPELTDQVIQAYADDVEVAREHAEAVAASAAKRLQEAGRTVRWSISVGDAAHEIIEAASTLGCDLVVVGSRGMTGLRRILLGSVARNVLLHTHASVLVVRDSVARSPERVRDVVRAESNEGDGVIVRPIEPHDDEALQHFYATLSDETRRWRFLGWSAGIRPNQARTFCTTDHEHREGFVAVMSRPAGDEIVGHLCLEPDDDGEAEMAVVVADAMQRRGIGRRLVGAAIEWGHRNGIHRFTATAACANTAIFALLRTMGLKARTATGRAGICDITIDLFPAVAVAV